ncbi:MAG: CBS domain-containing protein [Bdellovibrionota bacterium]
MAALQGTVSDLVQRKQNRDLVCVGLEDSLGKAIDIMQQNHFSQVPVTNHGKLLGMLREKEILKEMLSGRDIKKTTVKSAMNKNVPAVKLETKISSLQDLLLNSGSAVVINDDSKPVHIVTKIDLVEWLSSKAP